MAFDPALALQIQPPSFDLAKPFNALSSFAEAQTKTQQAYTGDQRIRGLQEYGKALQTGDENQIRTAIGKIAAADPVTAHQVLINRQEVRQAGAQDTYARTGDTSSLHAFPEALHTVNSARSIEDEDKRRQTLQKLDVGGRAAEGYLTHPTPDSWETMLDTMRNSGTHTEQELAPFRKKPNDIQAHRLRATGMHAREHMEATGEIRMNQPEKVSPTESIVRPSQLPGATGSMIPGGGKIIGGGTGAPTTTTPPKPTVSKAVADSPEYKEVPEVGGGDEQAGPGVIMQGKSPVTMEAKKAAIEHYHKEIRPAADASTKQLGELSNIRAMLEKGEVPTSRLAPLQETAAAAVYAVTKDVNLSKSLTGLDPTKGELFTKDSTRLGFDMARSQGAREAVQVIQYAFAANPNLRNTKEGNLLVTKVLEQLAQYNIDRSKYANAYQSKNGHMLGYAEWWDGARPISTYTSKVVPWKVPDNPNELKAGVTYEWKEGDRSYKGIWDPNANGFRPEK